MLHSNTTSVTVQVNPAPMFIHRKFLCLFVVVVWVCVCVAGVVEYMTDSLDILEPSASFFFLYYLIATNRIIFFSGWRDKDRVRTRR